MKELPEGLDINQLWATGNLDQINILLFRLLEQFRNKQFAVSDLVHNMIADPTSTLKLSYLSTGGFPEEKFQWITSSMLDTAGLNIRVVNDEIACGYKKEYLFRDGKWCFEALRDTIPQPVSARYPSGEGILTTSVYTECFKSLNNREKEAFGRIAGNFEHDTDKDDRYIEAYRYSTFYDAPTSQGNDKEQSVL